MKTKRSAAAAGFTLVELMIVVSIIGLLTSVALPNFMKVRIHAQSKTCIANLGKIEAAKQIWGVENGKTDGDATAIADLVPDYLKFAPSCPAAGDYEYKPIGTTATCTIGGHLL